MTGIRFRTRRALRLPALLVAALVWPATAAMAQDRSNGNFLDNLFNRGEQPAQSAPDQAPGQVAQSDPGELSVRLDRMENALRQLTGTIEQLQYRNQQLETRLNRMQEGGQSPVPGRAMPQAAPPPPAQPGTSGRRSDVFDPAQQPNAPGAPRALGNNTVIAAPEPNDQPVGAPGGRDAGAPLDLTTLSANPPGPPAASAPSIANAGPVMAAPMPAVRNDAQLPPRNAAAPNPQLATLPPSASPQDEYDMAYGYVLHKDYALAEQAFRDFLRKHPNERLVPDAQYWLGETLFQRQRYRDAAESFLSVSTKFEKSGKAPDSLLRLGQSLAAMHQKEAACATLAEVGRKYPKASAGVKRGAAAEIKRAHC